MIIREQSRTLLTVREVADRLGQAEVTVRRHIAAGLVPAVRLGPGRGAVRVDAAELDQYVYGEPEDGRSGVTKMSRRLPAPDADRWGADQIEQRKQVRHIGVALDKKV